MNKGYLGTIDIKPTSRQIKWQETEFYGNIFFGMNTFTGSQWGDGFAPADLFWPEDYDVDYWVKTAKKARMKGLMITAKHYDGFCIFQSEHTDYCLKSCPNWQDGKGDIVRDLAKACKDEGLKFGIYIAPWDRHEKTYGKGKEYDDWFCNILTELCTNYGDLFCIWLDPHFGDGINGTSQDFDLPRYYKTIRELQPDCAIAGMGPDVRWAGNERGLARKCERSVVPAYLGFDEFGEKRNSASKKALSLTDPDLGSRKTIKKEIDFAWLPHEISVPMKSKWFWYKDGEYSSKTKDKLWKLYLDSVGNNSCFMLGLSPDKRCKFADNEEQILTAFGEDLHLNFGYNLAVVKGKASASSQHSEMYDVSNVLNTDFDKFWKPAENDKKPVLYIDFEEKDMFNKIVIGEHIRNGQHIEEFSVYYLDEKDKWRLIEKGTTIGYKRIVHSKPIETSRVKIVFEEYRESFEINTILIN